MGVVVAAHGIDTLHGSLQQDGRELMRSNSERDRHMTNHHASTLSHRKAYRDPHDYHASTSNGIKGKRWNAIKIK